MEEMNTVVENTTVTEVTPVPVQVSTPTMTTGDKVLTGVILGLAGIGVGTVSAGVVFGVKALVDCGKKVAKGIKQGKEMKEALGDFDEIEVVEEEVEE